MKYHILYLVKKSNENEVKYIDFKKKDNVQNLFRIFSNVQNLFRIFSNFQNLFRIFSNVQNLFRIFSNVQNFQNLFSNVQNLFRIFSNFQNFQNIQHKNWSIQNLLTLQCMYVGSLRQIILTHSQSVLVIMENYPGINKCAKVLRK